MATVATLETMLERKLFGYGAKFTQPQKIAALDAGKEKVWLALQVAAKNGLTNWFAVSDTVTVLAGDRSVDLPADLHDILSVESESAKMLPGGWHKANWRDQREAADAVAVSGLSEVLWIVRGTNPAVLEIGPKLLDNLDVTVTYNKMLPTWDASGDEIDAIPSPYFDSICNYAAADLLTAAQDGEIGPLWRDAWARDLDLMIGVGDNRQRQAGVVTPSGSDSR